MSFADVLIPSGLAQDKGPFKEHKLSYYPKDLQLKGQNIRYI